MKSMETKAYSIIEEAYKEYYPVIYRYVRCRIKCKYGTAIYDIQGIG